MIAGGAFDLDLTIPVPGDMVPGDRALTGEVAGLGLSAGATVGFGPATEADVAGAGAFL